MNCYLGNVHVPPITRMLKTYNSDGVYASGNDDPLLNEGDDQGGKGRSLLLRRRRERRAARKSKGQNFTLDYISLSQMAYNMDEPVEEKIAK